MGLRKAKFEVTKFRSMVQDAEKNGAVWSTQNDTRVTRFGGFVRKTRIGELPQFFNVLKGEMSLGVTGWARISYPYGASEEDALKKLEYDLYYMKHMSLALDLLVIFKTIKIVLFVKGGV